MVKNIKKRSASESEVVEKKVEVVGNVNKAFKKKKPENKSVQNGQGDKQIKKDVPKNLKVGVKKNVGPVQNLNKKNSNVTPKNTEKPKLDNKENHGKKKNRSMSVNFTVDQLKEKIESINNRDELSKTAKRKLAFLRKLLIVKEGKDTTQDAEQLQKARNQKSVEAVKNKQVQNKAQNKMVQGKAKAKLNNQNKKKDVNQKSRFVMKPQEEEEEEDEDEDEDEEMDAEESKDEDESDVEEEEEEEEEEEVEGESEEEVEDEEEEEEEESEDEAENNKVKTNNVQPAPEKEKNKNDAEAKKKRYVVFVGNLPFNITSEEIKKHFLTKVGNIVDIRIPTNDANTPRGFAYVEFANNTDFEKAFSLHHSMLNGRRVNVQYSGVNKKEGVAKNFKLQALQKAGKFAGGRNRYQHKNFGNKGGK